MRRFDVQKKGSKYEVIQSDSLEFASVEELNMYIHRQEAALVGCRAEKERLAQLEQALASQVQALRVLRG